MQTCPRCGKKIPDPVNNCTNCGKKIESGRSLRENTTRIEGCLTVLAVAILLPAVALAFLGIALI